MSDTEHYEAMKEFGTEILKDCSPYTTEAVLQVAENILDYLHQQEERAIALGDVVGISQGMRAKVVECHAKALAILLKHYDMRLRDLKENK